MGEPNALPNRTKIGSKVFSPWVDRVSLVALALVGYFSAPEISSVLEEWLGGWSMVVTGCGLLVLVPLIATWIGKLNVRIRA